MLSVAQGWRCPIGLHSRSLILDDYAPFGSVHLRGAVEQDERLSTALRVRVTLLIIPPRGRRLFHRGRDLSSES